MNRHAFSEAVTELFDALGKFMMAVGQEYVDRHVAAGVARQQVVEPNPLVALLSKRQLAERLGVTSRTIDTWMAQQRIPYLKIGRSVRFSFDEVSSHLKEKYRVGARGWR